MPNNQPSFLSLYFKIFIYIFLGCLVLTFLGTSLTVILGVAFWVTMMILAVRLFNTVVMDAMFRNDPSYQQFRKQGGNMYDVAINPMSKDPREFSCPDCGTKVLLTGYSSDGRPMGECNCGWGAVAKGTIDPETFVPPAHWEYECPRCEQAVEHAIDVCWNCGLGEGETQRPEPEYTDFVPPRAWQYQCPKCGARVEHAVGTCWRCNYGAPEYMETNSIVRR